MLDWFRKPKADKPADGKDAAPKPPGAAAQPPAPASQPSSVAAEESVAANLASAGVVNSISGAGKASFGPVNHSSAVVKPSSAAEITSATGEIHFKAPEITSVAAEAISQPTEIVSKTSSDAAPAPESHRARPEIHFAAASQAPDRPAKLPPNIADSGATVFIPREEVKLQAPTIAVTVPASAVASAPADKVKTAPSATDLSKAEPPPKDDARLGTAVAERSGDTALAPRGAEPAVTLDRSAGGESGVALRFPPQSKTPSVPAPPTPPKPATWKNLPAKEPWCPSAIAAQAPELRKVAAADAVAFERVLPGWRAAGASRRGRMHANGGTHREDALAFDAHDRATVLCVSDGAGSCQHSRIGSHIAAHRVVEMLLAATEKVDPAIAADATKLKDFLSARVTEAVLAATDALLDLAKKSGGSPKDFRCTLLTALHYRGEQHELLLTNQIGDGAICLLRKDLSTARLGASDSGTHSGEVSCFVPDDCARVKAKAVDITTDVAALECVLLCSDGIEDPFYPLEKQAGAIFRQFYTGVTTPLPDFKAQLPQPAPLLQESAAWGLAQWLEFEKRGENDDRTVAVLHRLPQTISF